MHIPSQNLPVSKFQPLQLPYMHMPHALPDWGQALPLACMLTVGALGLTMAFGMLAQHGGFHSLALSRIGDVLCFASMMCTPPATFFAVGALEFIRGL